jgi:hypothetical protein
MSSDLRSKPGAEVFQRFSDQAITDPAELAALSRALFRQSRRSLGFWLVAVVAALVVGVLIGLLLLP